MEARDIILAPVITEKGRAGSDREKSTPSGWPTAPTRSRSPKRWKDLRRQGAEGQHHQHEGPQAPYGPQRGATLPIGKRPSSP